MSEFTYHVTSTGKHRQFPRSSLAYRFRVNGKPMQSPKSGNVQIPTPWRYWGKQ